MDYGFWLSLIAVISLMVAVISWLFFLTLSIWRIEKCILETGHPRPCPWDGLGLRAMWYAWAIGLPSKSSSDFERWMLDPKDLAPYTKPFDKLLANILLVSSYTLLACIIIDWIRGVA